MNKTENIAGSQSSRVKELKLRVSQNIAGSQFDKYLHYTLGEGAVFNKKTLITIINVMFSKTNKVKNVDSFDESDKKTIEEFLKEKE